MTEEEKNYRQPWFKFYSQDWLTDLKVRRMSIEDKLSFIVLLCLANSSKERGTVLNVTEDDIIHYAGFYDDPYNPENEAKRAKGCLGRFHSNGSCVTSRNEDGTFNVEIVNFLKRQNASLTNAERQARFRNKAKNKDGLESYESNASDVTEVTYREEENRVEKSIEDKKVYGEFRNVRLKESEYSILVSSIGEKNTSILIEELSSYMASRGKHYKSHYATLQNWARRKVQEHKSAPVNKYQVKI